MPAARTPRAAVVATTLEEARSVGEESITLASRRLVPPSVCRRPARPPGSYSLTVVFPRTPTGEAAAKRRKGS